jgi:hypothetical protein
MLLHFGHARRQHLGAFTGARADRALLRRRKCFATWFYSLCLLLMSFSGLASQACADVVISGGSTETQSRVARYTGPPSNTFDTIVQLFTTNGTTATASGSGFSSTTTSNLSAVGNTASFFSTFDQSRPAGLSADLSQGVVQAQFSTSIDVTYVASGTYTASGAGVSRLASTLYDFTSSSYVFISLQANENVPTAFTLGGTAGNSQNQLVGSMTGTLPGGHTFAWLAQTDTQATTDDGGATGSGSISLILVPEPGTLVAMLVLSLTTTLRRRAC